MNHSDTTEWRQEAIEYAGLAGVGDGGFIEPVENLLAAITLALFDLTDAVRALPRQQNSLAELLDAAPTAEALALLLRAQKESMKENQ